MNVAEKEWYDIQSEPAFDYYTFVNYAHYKRQKMALENYNTGIVLTVGKRTRLEDPYLS